MGVRRRLTRFFSHGDSGKRRGATILISVKFSVQQKQKLRHAKNRCVKIQYRCCGIWCYELRKIMLKAAEKRKHIHACLLFLVVFLPLVFWLRLCVAFWLFSMVLRTADSYRSFIQGNKRQCCYHKKLLLSAINTHLLLLQSLLTLLLHSSPPRLLPVPVLQEFPLALLQLLFMVAPGPLLPLQPAQLPRGWGEKKRSEPI